jgi:hypothetical protein
MGIGIWIRKICVGVESGLLETCSERLCDWLSKPPNSIDFHAHVHTSLASGIYTRQITT